MTIQVQSCSSLFIDHCNQNKIVQFGWQTS